MRRELAVAHLYGRPLSVGGVETHILSLAAHRDAASHRFTVLAPASSSFSERATALDAQVIPWKPLHALDVTALPSLLAHLRRQGANLLHVHSARCLVLARLAAAILGLPTVMTVHLPAHLVGARKGWIARLKRRLYLAGERLIGRGFPDRIIHVSCAALEEARRLGLAPDRTVLVENGFEAPPSVGVNERLRLRRSLGVDSDAPVAICVARLDPQKGIDVLIQALARMGVTTEARFWLVGDGPLAATLERSARRLPEGRVLFLGRRDDVPALLAASDIFVLPSRAETLSLALIEAMAAGLPCVVTDVGDAGRLVADGVSGFLVPPDDAGALEAGLTAALADRNLREAMGREARRRATTLTADRMAAGVQEVYVALLSHGREGEQRGEGANS
jgi:glycosyltransferase involved in cell wall biosynthesis